MLWVWFITAIVLLAIVVLLLRWLSQPIAYRRLLLTDTRRFLQSFLQQSGAGSILVLDRESGPGFLQIAIGKRQRDQLEIEFGVPDAAWSRQHFDIVHGAMGNAGFINRVETNSDNENIPRFLRVYVRGNRDELSRVVPQVLELAANALGFRMGDRYTLRMSGAVSSEYQTRTRHSVRTTTARWSHRSYDCPLVASISWNGTAKMTRRGFASNVTE